MLTHIEHVTRQIPGTQEVGAQLLRRAIVLTPTALRALVPGPCRLLRLCLLRFRLGLLRRLGRSLCFLRCRSLRFPLFSLCLLRRSLCFLRFSLLGAGLNKVEELLVQYESPAPWQLRRSPLLYDSNAGGSVSQTRKPVVGVSPRWCRSAGPTG